MKNAIIKDTLADFDEEKLKQSIGCIKKMAPMWSSERIWSYLRYSKDLNVSRRIIQDLIKRVVLQKNEETNINPALQKLIRTKSKSIIWQMNAFEIQIEEGAEFNIIFVMEASTGIVKGYSFSASSNAWYWLLALNQALEKGLILQEELCVVTSIRSEPSSPHFMKACWDLGIHHQMTKEYLPGDTYAMLFHHWIERNLSSHFSEKSFVDALDQCVNTFNQKMMCRMENKGPDKKSPTIVK